MISPIFTPGSRYPPFMAEPPYLMSGVIPDEVYPYRNHRAGQGEQHSMVTDSPLAPLWQLSACSFILAR